MKKNKLVYLIFIISTIFLTIPWSYALSFDDLKRITIEGGIKSITNAILSIVGVVAVLYLIIGGFQYITSVGNPDQTQKAKSTIMYAIIGIIVIILSYAIVAFVVKAF